jgi:hypothetical protein
MPDLFDGVKVRIGRQDYIVPALTLRQVRKHRGTLQRLNELAGRDPSEDELDAVVELVHAAVARNYPDITTDALYDGLDFRNLRQVLQAITAQSGVEETKPGEPAAG